MTNPIPDSVAKEWDLSAIERYPDYPDYFPHGNQSIKEIRESYLSGRQDEYRKQVGEIESKDKTIERQFNQQKFMAEEIERLKGLIRDIWESKDNGDATGDNEYWNMFKQKHNI